MTQVLKTRSFSTPAYILMLLIVASCAHAFHDGGVGSCKGCHIMHLGEDGLQSTTVSGALLKGDSASDVCLSCHGDSQMGVMGLDPLNPPPELGAGNFVFLFEDELNDQTGGGGSLGSVPGYHAGHSIVAPGQGLAMDPDYTTAPGGSYPASELGCTSCHDPHVNGNFRMLYGAGPIQGGLHTFTNPAPVAEGLPVGVPGMSESPASHTAYLSGVSSWCSNCHGAYHDLVGSQNFSHDFDLLFESGYVQRYDEYDGDADPTGGDPATSYLPEVSFEDPGATITSTSGPSISSRVTCLTCHRAHATSAPAGLRWDARVNRLSSDGLRSGSYPIPSPYTDPNQRQLCLKCHEPDHAMNSTQSCFVCHQRQPSTTYPEIGN